MSTSEILTRAADLIEERGHAKDWYCDESGALCIVGAMCAAVGIEPEPYTATDGTEEGWSTWGSNWQQVRAAQERFERLAGLPVGHDAPSWNDREETTGAEVVAKLREAAEAARAET